MNPATAVRRPLHPPTVPASPFPYHPGSLLSVMDLSVEGVAHILERATALEKEDPLKTQIVNLRFFAGMSMKETAHVLGLSERTLHRHWRFIRAWLKSRIGQSDAPC